MVREMSDDEAVILMVDRNLQREHLLTSEKAFAYKMKLEALKHQGKSTSTQLVQKGSILLRLLQKMQTKVEKPFVATSASPILCRRY